MRIVITLLLCIPAMLAAAQKKTVKWGYLRDSATGHPIALASVTNANTGKTVMTASSGRFSIELNAGQILSFAAVGYHFDTLRYDNRYTGQDTLSLVLASLSGNLTMVTVNTKGMNQYQRDSLERRNDFLQDIGGRIIPSVAASNSGAGIALNIDRFSRREKAKRKAYEFYESFEKEAYINYRFTPAMVHEYSGLKDDALQDFMQQYRPSYQWLRSHTSEEDLKYYINDKLKLYFKRG